MWLIKVLGMIAHGDCPTVEYTEPLWLVEVTDGVVKLTPDRDNAARYETIDLAHQVSKRPVMKYHVVGLVKLAESEEA